MNSIKPVQPGVCIPWEEAKKDFPADFAEKGDAALTKKVWEENDAESYMFLWQLVLSF